MFLTNVPQFTYIMLLLLILSANTLNVLAKLVLYKEDLRDFGYLCFFDPYRCIFWVNYAERTNIPP